MTSNGYLKLDPAVMHIGCILAGTFLARLGRPEVSNCIAGLEQYSFSYEEAGEQAREMRRVYEAVVSGESELNHMDSVTPKISPASVSHNSSPHMVQQQQQQQHTQQQLHSPHEALPGSHDHGATVMQGVAGNHATGNVGRPNFLPSISISDVRL